MPVLVKQIFGTSKDNASAGKLKRWVEHFKIVSPKCSEANCAEGGKLVGAPVEVLDGRHKGKKFIIPLCDALHKQHGEQFSIKDAAKCMPLEDLK